MTHAGELVAAYTITFGAIGAYATWLLAKRRAMSRVAGPERPDRAGIAGHEAGSDEPAGVTAEP